MRSQTQELNYIVPENQSGLLSADYLTSTFAFWSMNVFNYWVMLSLAKLGMFSYLMVDDTAAKKGRVFYGTLSNNIRESYPRTSLIKDIFDRWSVKGAGYIKNYDHRVNEIDAEFHIIAEPSVIKHHEIISDLRNRNRYHRDSHIYTQAGGWIIDIIPVTSSIARVALMHNKAPNIFWDSLYAVSQNRLNRHVKWPRFPLSLDLPVMVGALISTRLINHFMREKDLPEYVRNLRGIDENSLKRIDPLPMANDLYIEEWLVDSNKNTMHRERIKENDDLLITYNPDTSSHKSGVGDYIPQDKDHLKDYAQTIKKFGEYKATFFGAGHLGSWIALMLAFGRVKKYTLIDYDKIEYRNLAGAGYKFRDVGKDKIEQLSTTITEILREPLKISSSSVLNAFEPEIYTINNRLTQKTHTRTLKSIGDSNLFIVSTDSWNSRYDFAMLLRRMKNQKLLLKENVWIIDCRSLERSGKIVIANINNADQFKKYLSPLEESSVDTTALPCDRANVIDLPLHLARYVYSLLWNHHMGKHTLPDKTETNVYEYYVDAYNYKLVQI